MTFWANKIVATLLVVAVLGFAVFGFYIVQHNTHPLTVERLRAPDITSR